MVPRKLLSSLEHGDGSFFMGFFISLKVLVVSSKKAENKDKTLENQYLPAAFEEGITLVEQAQKRKGYNTSRNMTV